MKIRFAVINSDNERFYCQSCHIPRIGESIKVKTEIYIVENVVYDYSWSVHSKCNVLITAEVYVK